MISTDAVILANHALIMLKVGLTAYLLKLVG